MAEPDIALAAMRRLKERGVKIALDDFGTGYSSIGYLRSFPFDRLKLDRSICADITTSADVQQLVQGTIAIARSMGLKVTAEGIEDEFQAKFLRLAGCELLQGFHFNRPMPASEITPRLMRGAPPSKAPLNGFESAGELEDEEAGDDDRGGDQLIAGQALAEDRVREENA
jgi:EAL domain-containing protein (putative c-di-GMP-specific phosphodiesterase class I)